MEPSPCALVAPHEGIDATASARVPVTVLAGFLGSGKTTLLNRILAAGHGLRVAVLVNDFGSINIDSRLVVSRDADVIELENGCVCCTVRSDLVAQLTVLLEGPHAPQHVLIETSGVADPGRLLVALRDPHLRRLARTDGVITLVDAAGIATVPASSFELVRRQLVNADLIVLNKTDLVSRGDLAALRKQLAYPRARIVEAAHARVPLALVLGLDRRHDDVDAGTPGQVEDTTHGDEYSTWSWTSDEPLAYGAIRSLLTSLPAAVYRAKGFLYLAEAPEQRVAAHVVGRRVDVRPHGAWGGAEPRSELVFVSLERQLDIVWLRERLASTVSGATQSCSSSRAVAPAAATPA